MMHISLPQGKLVLAKLALALVLVLVLSNTEDLADQTATEATRGRPKQRCSSEQRL